MRTLLEIEQRLQMWQNELQAQKWNKKNRNQIEAHIEELRWVLGY